MKIATLLIINLVLYNVTPSNYVVSVNGVGGNIQEGNAQITLTEPRLGWEEVKVLLEQ